MKPIFFVLITLCLFSFTACQDDDDGVPMAPTPSALLLQIDYQTLEFEGGFRFADIDYDQSVGQDSFPAEVIYNPPGDFGDLTIRLMPPNQTPDTLFFGTIIWSGTGDIQQPTPLSPASDFAETDAIAPINSIDTFDLNPYQDPDSISLETLYDRVSNLAEVSNALSSPGSRLGWFWYPRSVGVGDPAEWDYYLIVLE
ncbi:MAG: hypothetical protein AAFU67_10380 [Bacteroidota bacterium]